MYIIGVAGQMRAGKDSLADYLQQYLNRCPPMVYWHRGAFAKAVKQIFMDAFDKDPAYVEKWKVVKEAPPDLDMPVRKALQFIGDGFRNIKSSIWIDLALMGDYPHRNDCAKIISDVRYRNELKAIYDNGGFNILIVRPDKINNDPNGSEAQMRPFVRYALKLHLLSNLNSCNLAEKFWTKLWNLRLLSVSKPKGWEYIHYVLINNGTLEDMYKHAGSISLAINEHFSKVTV
jgi:hypothetical protein